MAKHVNRWRPDTCDCVLDYAWDDTDPPQTRNHSLEALISRGVEAAHLTILDPRALYAAIVDENTRKNSIPALAKQAKPAFLDSDYTWSFDANRVLIVNIAGLSVAQKALLQNLADTQLGVGKVVVQ